MASNDAIEHVGLDRRRRGQRARVATLDDHRRVARRDDHVAGVEVPAHRDVSGRVRELVVERGRVLGECLERVEDGGQHLVADVDQRQCPARGRLVERRDRGDLVAHAPDAVALQGHVVAVVPEGPLLDVAGVDHGDDPGQGLGGRGVDREDPGVGVGAAQDRADQEPGEAQVVGVARPARDLLGGVELGEPLPDDPEIVREVGGLGVGECHA